MNETTDLMVERIMAAPRDRVWTAWTNPDHLKRWWAPQPFHTPECEIDLRPGGIFYTRMTGPDGFDFRGTGCFLEIVPGQRIVWTSALLPGYRPADIPEHCGAFPFTALVTLEDAGDGKTHYRAVAMHKTVADRATHQAMGFEQGWGLCAAQLEQVAAGLAATA